MPKRILSIIFVLLFTVLLGSIENSFAQRQRPPEYKDLMDARKIENPKEKIKAFEVIKKNYPESRYLESIDRMILGAEIEICDSVEKIVKLQKETLEYAEGADQITEYLVFERKPYN